MSPRPKRIATRESYAQWKKRTKPRSPAESHAAYQQRLKDVGNRE